MKGIKNCAKLLLCQCRKCHIFEPKINTSTFLKICLLDFSEVAHSNRHLKVGENDCFGFWMKINVIFKMRYMDQVLEPGSIFTLYLVVFILPNQIVVNKIENQSNCPKQ